MKMKYCISQQTITALLQPYGGRYQYSFDTLMTTEPQYEVCFYCKKRPSQRLTMRKLDGTDDVMITLTKGNGRIYQRDFYSKDESGTYTLKNRDRKGVSKCKERI